LRNTSHIYRDVSHYVRHIDVRRIDVKRWACHSAPEPSRKRISRRKALDVKRWLREGVPTSSR